MWVPGSHDHSLQSSAVTTTACPDVWTCSRDADRRTKAADGGVDGHGS